MIVIVVLCSCSRLEIKVSMMWSDLEFRFLSSGGLSLTSPAISLGTWYSSPPWWNYPCGIVGSCSNVLVLVESNSFEKYSSVDIQGLSREAILLRIQVSIFLHVLLSFSSVSVLCDKCRGLEFDGSSWIVFDFSSASFVISVGLPSLNSSPSISLIIITSLRSSLAERGWITHDVRWFVLIKSLQWSILQVQTKFSKNGYKLRRSPERTATICIEVLTKLLTSSSGQYSSIFFYLLWRSWRSHFVC